MGNQVRYRARPKIATVNVHADQFTSLLRCAFGFELFHGSNYFLSIRLSIAVSEGPNIWATLSLFLEQASVLIPSVPHAASFRVEADGLIWQHECSTSH
jgi:hypothetical protein